MKFASPAGLLPLISGMTGGRLRGFLRAPAAFFRNPRGADTGSNAIRLSLD